MKQTNVDEFTRRQSGPYKGETEYRAKFYEALDEMILLKILTKQQAEYNQERRDIT
ncbi:hypothetical protein [Streptococcus fryi]